MSLQLIRALASRSPSLQVTLIKIQFLAKETEPIFSN